MEPGSDMFFEVRYEFYRDYVGEVYQSYEDHRKMNADLSAQECLKSFFEENEGDGDVINIFSYEMLSRLVYEKRVNGIRTLVKLGANVNCTKMHSLLHEAAVQSTPEVIQVLIDCGANINSVDCMGGRTPLFCATCCEDNCYENVKCLIENGADPHIPDNSGQCPITICLFDDVRELLENADDLQTLGPKSASKLY